MTMSPSERELIGYLTSPSTEEERQGIVDQVKARVAEIEADGGDADWDDSEEDQPGEDQPG